MDTVNSDAELLARRPPMISINIYRPIIKNDINNTFLLFVVT